MAFVYFKCNCAKSLAVDDSEAGRQVQCPDCGTPLLVPEPDVFWKCACGEEMSASRNLAGSIVQCAACETEHTVPVRLSLKRDNRQRDDFVSDVPRVPVARTSEVQCPKCGYMSPQVLARCPQCQNYLHKGAAIRRKFIAVAQPLLIIALGWFLASRFSCGSGKTKDNTAMEMPRGVTAAGAQSNFENIVAAPNVLVTNKK